MKHVRMAYVRSLRAAWRLDGYACLRRLSVCSWLDMRVCGADRTNPASLINTGNLQKVHALNILRKAVGGRDVILEVRCVMNTVTHATSVPEPVSLHCCQAAGYGMGYV